MVLCLTRADGITKESREGFVEQIMKHEKLKKYFDGESLFVLYMGCADHKFRSFGSEEQYINTLNYVVRWRENFFKAIFQSSHRVDLRTTCIFGQRQEDIKKLLEMCVSELKTIPKMDQDLGETKFYISGHVVNMALLFKHKLIIEDKKDCKNLSSELWELIQSTRNSKINDELKKQLLEPWEWKNF